MSEASIRSPILTPSSSSPKPKFKKRSAPLLRGYSKTPAKPLLSDVRWDITNTQNPSESSISYYAILASKLACSGRLNDFVMVSESVLSNGDSAKFVKNVNVKMVSEGIVEVLGKDGLDRVIQFVKDAQRVGIRTCKLFDQTAMEALMVQCRILVNEGKLVEFVRIVEILADHKFPIEDIIDPIHVLNKFISNRDFDMCIRYASIYPHSQVLFCSIIEEFGKKNDLKLALKVFEELKKQPGGITMFACRSIIDVCGLCHDYIQSRSIFEGLLEEKITPNVYVFNSLMSVNANDMNYTLEIYRRMQVLGVKPDLRTYNILLKACSNSRKVDLALKIYKEIRSLKLSLHTYSSMIKVLSDAKMWETVLTIKSDMISSGVHPNLITWTSLLNSCANCGMLEHALNLFDEMQTLGFEPNTQCYNIILQACVKSVQFDRAFRFFHLWKDSIRDFEPDLVTFNTLLKGCGEDYHRAKSLMRDMECMGVSPDRISWSILMDICGKARNFKGALIAFEDMKGSGIQLDVAAFNTMLKVCVENKKMKMAFSIFNDMKRFRLQPNKITYNTLLRARIKYGSLYEVQQSLAIYLEMRQAGYGPNDYYVKELIEEWCEGVLSIENKNNSNLNSNSKRKSEEGKPFHVLLEKVAILLQQDGEHNQVIDVRGLSKVEARIVVLSILRMIKENYLLGKNIEDNMVIISGSESDNQEVQDAIVHVLMIELGLTVVTGYNNKPKPNMVSPKPFSDNGTKKEDFKFLARRPRNLGLITVPRESILQWLHKKTTREIHT